MHRSCSRAVAPSPHPLAQRPRRGHFPGRQRGFAALMLAMLVLMLVLVPAMWLFQSAADRQRVLDAQVRAMLKGTPRPAPAAPAPAPPAESASGNGSGSGETPAQSR